MSSESESVSPCLNIEKCSLVLVDVAGTTTSINFVKDTLFPFVTAQVEEFLKGKWEEEAVKECVNLIKDDDDLDLAAAVEKIKSLTLEDSDNKGLKTLQGLIYKEGYEKGDLKAHIFDDVVEALESWAKNRRVAVYSTGSVDSQKLLFSHTTHGDISAHIHKYFDQEVGLKTDSDSYKSIAKEVEVTPEEVVFITDDIKEATAAKNGGVTAVLIKREGNAELPEESAKEFTVISSFKDLALEKTAKRKNEEEAAAEEAPPTKVPKTDTEETEKPQQTEKKVEQTESMEVDTGKKPEETEITAVTEPTSETEKCVEPELEKTETKEETTESEKKEDEKMETGETEDAKVEVMEEEKETKQATETKEEVKESTEKAKETTEETKETAEETKEAKEETKEVTAEETKETQKEEKNEKTDEKPTDESPKEEAAAPAQETTEEEAKVDDKSMENGDEKPETKAEEKENKSVLANGVENGKEGAEKPGETSEVQLDEQSDEVKVKKLEESAESKTVSVEV